MMKIAVLFAVLFVSAQAVPFGFHNPNNLDTPDDGEVAAAAAGGAGEAGVAGQAATPLPSVSPGDGGDSSSSSSSSSEEDAGSEGATGGGVATTPMVAGPLAGPGREGQAAAGTGGSSNDAVVPAAGGPIINKNMLAAAGGSSGAEAQQYLANALNSQTILKQTERKQSGALIAVTILGLVGGVAGLTIAAYKNRVSITSHYSRLAVIH